MTCSTISAFMTLNKRSCLPLITRGTLCNSFFAIHNSLQTICRMHHTFGESVRRQETSADLPRQWKNQQPGDLARHQPGAKSHQMAARNPARKEGNSPLGDTLFLLHFTRTLGCMLVGVHGTDSQDEWLIRSQFRDDQIV